MVFAAAGLDPLDVTLHAVAVRTGEITPPMESVEPCMGAPNSALLADLEPRAEYQFELALFDDGDFATPETVPPRARIVARQNFRFTDSASMGFVCMGAVSCAAVYEQVTLRARALCATARQVARCSIDIPFAGRCSLPR